MKLIVGLGNPGKKYDKTRHNLGFRVLDRLHDKLGMPNWTEKYDSLLSQGHLFKERVLLLKPQTFMNLSGSSVGPIASYFKVDTEHDLWVVHDDLDLPVGAVRLSIESTSGGHRGAQSIITNIGHKKFARFRIGIGRPEDRTPVEDFVLHPFEKKDEEIVQAMVDHTTEQIVVALREGLEGIKDTVNKP